MTTRILILDLGHVLSRIAGEIALKSTPSLISIVTAGFEPQRIDGQLKLFLDRLEIPEMPAVSFHSVASQIFDIVITIGKEAGDRCPILPGVPASLRWDLQEPDISDFSSLKSFAVVLQGRMEDLFGHGFLSALLRQKTCLENVVDSLHEGIIAHDLNRKIFLFSNGAQEITGAERHQILGRDCHDIFKPNFCGDKCIFCDNEKTDLSKTSRSSYTAIFTGVEGSRKELEVIRRPLKDEGGSVVGAIISVSDATRIRELEMKLNEAESFDGIIGQDHKMLSIFDLIRDVASSDFPVIITGESGTGKELVATAIHKESSRRDRLFVPVNCGALPEGTLESELFGHLKGSFTGAIRDKKGRFELADKGTLFLDEIAELSLRMQVKLLRVLQEGTFEPVGSEIQKKVSVRIICATNSNLLDLIAAGKFREDLYYRLAVVPIEVPPLRERRNDIAALAAHFLSKTSGKLSRGEMVFSEETSSILMNYNWPGNIRQLQNSIQFAMIKCRGQIIQPEHLPPEVLASTFIPLVHPRLPGKVGRRPKLTSEIVERALVKAGGNKAKAARMLGVGRATLYNFINSNKEMAEFV